MRTNMNNGESRLNRLIRILEEQATLSSNTEIERMDAQHNLDYVLKLYTSGQWGTLLQVIRSYGL